MPALMAWLPGPCRDLADSTRACQEVFCGRSIDRVGLEAMRHERKWEWGEYRPGRPLEGPDDADVVLTARGGIADQAEQAQGLLIM
jgi:hypothetical protein